jgi:uncharacterized protein YpuA (DUF1002 family)
MTSLVILIVGLMVIGFFVWIIKQERASDRDFETLKRLRYAEFQVRMAKRELERRSEIRETAEKLLQAHGVDVADDYYNHMMSAMERISVIDPEYKALFDDLEKVKRKNE